MTVSLLSQMKHMNLTARTMFNTNVFDGISQDCECTIVVRVELAITSQYKQYEISVYVELLIEIHGRRTSRCCGERKYRPVSRQ